MHELFQQTIFMIFAVIAVISALMVVTLNNPVRCVLFLVLCFFASSVLWILAHAEFLALILVLVYVGAVMTLFLFVVMMLNVEVTSLKTHFARYLPFGLLIVALFVALTIVAITPEHFTQATKVTVESSLTNTQQLGMVLYTKYVYAFELAAVLLLVAIIAAITLAHRTIKRSKTQDIKQQIMTPRNSRVKLVKMRSVNQSNGN